MEDSKKLNKAPVYYALVQAHFNPIAAMATKYIDGIQDEFRKAGYSRYEESDFAHLVFSSPGEDGQPQLAHGKNWIFSKADKTSGFVLNQHSITYQTTDYDSRKEFLNGLLNGFQIVHSTINLDYISRLGLRYLDAIIPDEGEDVTMYLQPSLHGVEISGAKRHIRTQESVFLTETGLTLKQGTLVSRIYQVNGPLGFPPGISPQGLELKPRFQISDSIDHAVLDTDHFVEGLIGVDVEQVQQILSSLQQGASKAFNAMVTSHALGRWAEE